LIIPSLPPFLWVDFSTDNILNTPTSGASNIEICTWWQNAKLFACKRSNFECRWHLHRTKQFSVTRKQGKFCFLLNCHTHAIMIVCLVNNYQGIHNHIFWWLLARYLIFLFISQYYATTSFQNTSYISTLCDLFSIFFLVDVLGFKRSIDLMYQRWSLWWQR
jgi:hypothetical protein